MVVASLRHEGDELLGQRKGLDAYRERGSTMGIPLLHPWANRLGGFEYTFAGQSVRLDGVRTDEHGLPIHGLREAVSGWELAEQGPARAVGGRTLDLPGFPFPHRIEAAVELSGGDRLTVTTTLTAGGDVPVPVCFGYHPYLRLPGAERAAWEVTLPVAERLLLDERGLPTGAREPAGALDGPLGERTFDDAFTGVSGPFRLAGGGRLIKVDFETGYPFAQVFAPAEDDVACFEPMTAPADALRHDPPAVAPGEVYIARFSVTVSSV